MLLNLAHRFTASGEVCRKTLLNVAVRHIKHNDGDYFLLQLRCEKTEQNTLKS